MRQVAPAAAVAALAVLAVPGMLDFYQAQPVTSTANARGSGIPNSVLSKTKDDKVCKSIQITGSRHGATPVCKTKQEWEELASRYRHTIARGQTTTFKWSPSGGGATPQ